MPPTVDVSLSEMTRLLLPLAPLLHLCFSMWMFSNTDIFQHVRTHTLPSIRLHPRFQHCSSPCLPGCQIGSEPALTN